MNPERWNRIEALYAAALDVEPARRADFLRENCGADESLRTEVESLVLHGEGAGRFLEPAAKAKPLESGQKVLHYEIQKKLGEGGMGAVYLAYDGQLHRPVALKVLQPESAADPERRRRLLREARAASGLSHPNIVSIYQIGSDNGLNFIAMEFVEGKTLTDTIPANGLPLGKALDYAIQIADGLAKAHAAGVIHRDLKPGNVIVRPDGLLKLLDFGLARRVIREPGKETTFTAEGQISGTPAYMSPEQAEGKLLDVGSDIFGFGAVLYEMLTGRRAFQGDSAMSTLSAVLHQEPKPLGGEIPRDLAKVISRCLRKDPDRRFHDIVDVRVALLEIKEESDSGEALAAAPARRGKWPWALGAIAVILLASGLWFTNRRRSPVPQQKVLPVTTYPGSEMYPSFSPDGRQIAFSWNGEKGDEPGVYVKLLGEANPVRLTTGADKYPAWSPDGKRIAFVRGEPDTGVYPAGWPPDGNRIASIRREQATGIYTVAALGGMERKVAGLRSNSQISWSPDGKWLAISFKDQRERGILLLSIEGGEPRRVSDPNGPAFDISPAFAPDGERLAYVRCTGQAACDVYVQGLNAGYSPRGSPHPVTRQAGVVSGLTWSRDGGSIIYGAPPEAAGILAFLWRVDADGRKAPQRLEVAGPMAYCPSASPTGDRLVFYRLLRDTDIWRYRTDGVMEPLIVSSFSDNSPDFSPDGTKIAFSSTRSGEAMEIWVAEADGSKPVQMTDRLGRHQGTPRWSPDGRWIAFDSQGQDGHPDIYVMEAAGGSPRRITFESSDEVVPFWSRDGKWIYFRSDRTGGNEIWRVPFAGGPQEQVTTRGGWNGCESSDGQTLFYTKPDQGPLLARRISGGEEREVLSYVPARAFSAVADGIYFIGRRSDAGYYPLEFFQFSSGTSRLLAKIEGGGAQIGVGLSVSPDRKAVVFTKTVSVGADLMMIENFQ